MRRALVLSLLAPVACVPPPPPGDDGDDAGPAAQCALSDDAKLLVEQIATSYVRDTGTVGAHMRDDPNTRESAYAISLVGNPDKGRFGFAFLIESCTAPSAFEPYCEPMDFEDERAGQLCLRLRCEDAGILVSESWYAEDGRTEPGDRHAFTTTTTAPPGEVVYDPNPFIAWRADTTNDDDVAVTSDVDVGAVLTPAGGDPIDVSHTAALSARRVLVDDHEDLTAAIDVRFPALASSGTVTATIAVDVDGALTGSIELDGAPIAELPAALDEHGAMPLTWLGDCAE